MSRASFRLGLLLLATAGLAAGCNKPADKQAPVGDSGSSGGSAKEVVIKITGSDTMINLAADWAAAYRDLHPNVRIEVKGGGSGVGIAALIDGKVAVATSSRTLDKDELKKVKAKTGKDAIQNQVGLDALAIYLHPDNPLESISIEELAGIYSEGGGITQWEDLGVAGGKVQGKIVLVSRQNSSGTYKYFQEAVLGKGKDFRQGMLTQSGSSDVVALVSRTPQAIGYSGMGYKADSVRFLPVAKKKGEKGVLPSIESATDGSYPISRPLFLYTAGEAEGAVKEFLDWVLTAEGQAIVKEAGYVPLPK